MISLLDAAMRRFTIRLPMWDAIGAALTCLGVAGKVISLAQRSANSAKEIRVLIGAGLAKVESGARLVAESLKDQASQLAASVSVFKIAAA